MEVGRPGKMHTPAERGKRSAARNGRSGLYRTEGETAVTVVTGSTAPRSGRGAAQHPDLGLAQ